MVYLLEMAKNLICVQFNYDIKGKIDIDIV